MLRLLPSRIPRRRTAWWCSGLATLALAAVPVIGGARVERVASAARADDSAREQPVAAPQAKRWLQRNTVVHLDPSIEALGPGAEAAVRSAFEVWYSAGVDLPQVHFAKTPVVDAEAGPDGLNTVSAKPLETPGHEHDLAITATYRNLNTGEVTEADIIINSRKPWGGLSDAEEECENHFDLPSVLVHEAGHFFGLRDESTDHTSTMYLVTNACEIHKRTLTGSDIQTVNELYADGFEDQPEIQCSAAARPDVPPPSGAIMLAILACLGVIRRRQRGMPAAA